MLVLISGTIDGSRDESKFVGGICGAMIIRNDGQAGDVTKANRIQYCYNSANITSYSNNVGGICGFEDIYCYLRNCHVASDIVVRGPGLVEAAGGGGSSENGWTGKMIGRASETAGGTYVGENSLEITPTETVYYVVNSLNSGNSQYWSNSNVNEPKLLWE